MKKQKKMPRGAIVSGFRHSINLIVGVLNPTAGDCAFESVISNINHRDCFDKKNIQISKLIQGRMGNPRRKVMDKGKTSMGTETIKDIKCYKCTKLCNIKMDLNYHRRQHHMQTECNACNKIIHGELKLHTHKRNCN